ncbi:MAG: translation elongation factor Ts [Candidatus Caenarcaniphilales bacterium]|nr:translation elongation factor Ts [Candidatus Caenarcaniphilales bacterium]
MTVKVASSDISELRERTGAGLSDCKKALMEADNDLNKAAEILRQKGLAASAKKAGKVAAEGAVIAAISSDAKQGVLIELNSQTDFVARNEKFQSLLKEIVDLSLAGSFHSLDQLQNAKISTGDTVLNLISLKSAEIGEKLDLRRFVKFEAGANESLASYTHPIGSRIAVLVKLQSNPPKEAVGKDIAMHIAASQPAPEFLNRDAIPAEIFENEKRIELGKEDLKNKPPEIAEKIVTGRVEKVLLERVLLEQAFVKNPGQKIKDYLKDHGAAVIDFLRFNLGEGIERNTASFADEVAAQMKGS